MKSRKETGETLHPYWLMLHRRRHVVLGVAAATVVSLLAVLYFRQPVYRATAYLTATPLKGELQKDRKSQSFACADLQTQLRRPDLVWNIIKKLGLTNNPSRWILSEKSPDLITNVSVENPRTRVALMTIFLSQLTIRPQPKLPQIIGIQFLSADRILSASIANALAKGFVDTRADMAPADRNFLAKIDTDIHRVQTQIDQFTDTHTAADIIRDISEVIQRRSEMVKPLRNLEATVVEAELRYKSLYLPDGSVKHEALHSERLEQLRKEWKETETQWEKVVKRYRRRHPVYRKLKEKRDALRIDIRNEADRIIRLAKARYEKTHGELAALEKQHDKLAARLARLKKNRSTLESLQEELQRLQSKRDELSARIPGPRRGVIPCSLSNKFSLYSLAVAPPGPLNRLSPLAFLITLLAALTGGVGLAFLLEYYDCSVWTPDEVERVTGMRSVAAIPLLKAPRALSIGRITQDLPGCQAARAFEAFGATLEPFLRENKIRSLAVCSAHPWEGKTTIAVNLAIALAHMGCRALVVDGNLRSPSVHKILGHDGLVGLSHLLSENRAPAEVIMQTEVRGISILPAGRLTIDPLDLIGSAKMRVVLLELEKEFDVVIVDTPAALAATDAALLSSMVDMNLLVVRSGGPSSHELRMTLRRITSSGGRMMGLIVNRLNAYEAQLCGIDLLHPPPCISFDEGLTGQTG